MTELHARGAEVAIATHDAILREALLRALPGSASKCCLVCGARTRVFAGRRSAREDLRALTGTAWFRYAMRRWAESLGR
jgi:proline dehydrogenase